MASIILPTLVLCSLPTIALDEFLNHIFPHLVCNDRSSNVHGLDVIYKFSREYQLINLCFLLMSFFHFHYVCIYCNGYCGSQGQLLCTFNSNHIRTFMQVVILCFWRWFYKPTCLRLAQFITSILQPTSKFEQLTLQMLCIVLPSTFELAIVSISYVLSTLHLACSIFVAIFVIIEFEISLFIRVICQYVVCTWSWSLFSRCYYDLKCYEDFLSLLAQVFNLTLKVVA